MANENYNIMKISCGLQFSILLQSQSQCFGKNISNPLLCSGHGICIRNDQCSCGIGYQGNECQITTCFGKLSDDSSVCSGNGKCNSKDVCDCNDGYIGLFCNVKKEDKKIIVYATGYNAYGQLGTGSTNNENTFTNISNFNQVSEKIVSGVFHSFIINGGPTAYSFGRNNVIFESFTP
jgi:hypothetical protein